MALEVRIHRRRTLMALPAASLPGGVAHSWLRERSPRMEPHSRAINSPRSIADSAWKLGAGIGRSLHSGEKITALHSFKEEGKRAGVQRDSTD